MRRLGIVLLLGSLLLAAPAVPAQESIHGYSAAVPEEWSVPDSAAIDWLTALLVASLPESYRTENAEKELSLQLHNPETELFVLDQHNSGCSFVRTAAYNLLLPENTLLLRGMLHEVQLLAALQMHQIIGFSCKTANAEVMELEDCNVILLEYNGPFPGHRMAQCVMPRNNRFFLFSLNCRSDDYPERKAEFLEYLQTIRFDEPGN